jgi:hypothetical protein
MKVGRHSWEGSWFRQPDARGVSTTAHINGCLIRANSQVAGMAQSALSGPLL